MSIKTFQNKIVKPIRIIQFGEGKFLRAFWEEYIDDGNASGQYDGAILIVKPRKGGNIDDFRQQDCMYTLVTRGIKDGEIVDQKKIITSVDSVIQCDENVNAFLELATLDSLEVIVSNTTEAGICVNIKDDFSDIAGQSYPGKLTRLLFERYEKYGDAQNEELVILPLELNDKNGELLKNAVTEYIKIWGLSKGFKHWVETSVIFCNTLVDRIVSGYLDIELPYEDKLIDVCEPYKLFAIETRVPEKVKKKLPLLNMNSSVVISDNIDVYRERKVKVLNGVHTAVSLAAYNAGFIYVEQMMNDEVFSCFIDKIIYDEILTTINMETDKLIVYAEEIKQRFKNPFLYHRLKDISMNSISKFKVRVLPTMIDYKSEHGVYPKGLMFSLAALLYFYKNGIINKQYTIVDSTEVIEVFSKWDGKNIRHILSNEILWGEFTETIKEMSDDTTNNMKLIHEYGIKGAMKIICK
ncbi:MAG: tagaturonate reductase [Firmicutes bacterium]|nr:tagaturonate reductase [Bacillota bacterium]